jgi:ribonuclease E
MKKKMLINVADEEESRVAIVEDGILEELTIETSSKEQIKGNI